MVEVALLPVAGMDSACEAPKATLVVLDDTSNVAPDAMEILPVPITPEPLRARVPPDMVVVPE